MVEPATFRIEHQNRRRLSRHEQLQFGRRGSWLCCYPGLQCARVASCVALIAVAGPSVVTRPVFSSRIRGSTEMRDKAILIRTGWTDASHACMFNFPGIHTCRFQAVSSCPSHDPVRIDTQGPCLLAVQKTGFRLPSLLFPCGYTGLDDPHRTNLALKRPSRVCV